MENSENLNSSLKLNQINTLFKYDTEYSADSVEWCPHEPFHKFFVCANYELVKGEKGDKKSQKRLGKILLFSISLDDCGLKLWDVVDTAAILDQKWCHQQLNGHLILGVVNAEGSLVIYKFNTKKLKLEFVTEYKIEGSDDELLLLSLDWSTGKVTSNEPEIVCSDSKGSYHRFVLVNNRLSLDSSCKAHDYESWIAAFYYWDPNVFFTGGDDCMLAKYDKRIQLEPVIRNRIHTAGVTCIHSNAEKEFVFASGSYDEVLRLWDVRNMKLPINELKMPGPLWRLKWDPFLHDHLLAACMLGGAHVVCAKLSDNLEIIKSYHEHKNITYGADWSYLNESEVANFDHEGNRIIATCSFYDKLLCVSKLSVL